MVRIAILSSIGLEMPNWFNTRAHDAVDKSLQPYLVKYYPEWVSFAYAWNGTAYRSKAAQLYHEQFTQLIQRSIRPPPQERFLQEQALYGFFSSALSAVECFFYALYCVGAIYDPPGFPAADPRDLKVTPTEVQRRFERRFRTEAVTETMRSVLGDPQYKELADIRNVLSHRGAPPRQFVHDGSRPPAAMMPANPKDPVQAWTYSVEVNERTTEKRLSWLAPQHSKLLDQTEAFCANKVVV